MAGSTNPVNNKASPAFIIKLPSTNKYRSQLETLGGMAKECSQQVAGLSHYAEIHEKELYLPCEISASLIPNDKEFIAFFGGQVK